MAPTMTIRSDRGLRELAWAAPGIEVRTDSGRPPRLVGYAAVFNSKSVDLGGFVEIIRPGAFGRSLKGADVRALVNHDPNLILGRTKAGTLKVTEDDRGLRVEITPPATEAGRDAMENVRLGNLDGMSFGFITQSDRWNFSQEPPLRELLDVDVLDVSVVAFPAYPKTDVALRFLEAARAGRELAEARERRLAKIEQEIRGA